MDDGRRRPHPAGVAIDPLPRHRHPDRLGRHLRMVAAVRRAPLRRRQRFPARSAAGGSRRRTRRARRTSSTSATTTIDRQLAAWCGSSTERRGCRSAVERSVAPPRRLASHSSHRVTYDRYGSDVLAGDWKNAGRKPVPDGRGRARPRRRRRRERVLRRGHPHRGADRRARGLLRQEAGLPARRLASSSTASPCALVVPSRGRRGRRRAPHPDRSRSPAQKARVARASRIFVEGRHDAELVETRLGRRPARRRRRRRVPRGRRRPRRDRAASSRPTASRRIGVLVDHLVPGSKESRIAEQVARGPYGAHVLVVGHPYVDIWQAVKPARVGLAAWPVDPAVGLVEARHLRRARAAARGAGRHRARLEAHPRPGAVVCRPRAGAPRPRRAADRLRHRALTLPSSLTESGLRRSLISAGRSSRGTARPPPFLRSVTAAAANLLRSGASGVSGSGGVTGRRARKPEGGGAAPGGELSSVSDGGGPDAVGLARRVPNIRPPGTNAPKYICEIRTYVRN